LLESFEKGDGDYRAAHSSVQHHSGCPGYGVNGYLVGELKRLKKLWIQAQAQVEANMK